MGGCLKSNALTVSAQRPGEHCETVTLNIDDSEATALLHKCVEIEMHYCRHGYVEVEPEPSSCHLIATEEPILLSTGSCQYENKSCKIASLLFRLVHALQGIFFVVFIARVQ